MKSNYYSVTINPAPYKKWDKKFINELYELFEPETKIFSSNYHRLCENLQQEFLKVLCAVISCRFGGEWGNYFFEKTQLGNMHLHMHFKADIPDHVDLNQHPLVLELNKQLSSLKEYCAIKIERTLKDIKFWEKYEKKEQFDNLITKAILETEDDDKDE